MTKRTITTSTASIVGILGLSLLRHARWVENEDLESWITTIRRVLDSHADDPEVYRQVVRHMRHDEGYDLYADTYDDGSNPLISVEERAIAALLGISAAEQALDAACGTGRLCSLLAGMGHTVVGVDQSEAMLAKARARVPGASFKAGRLESLPLEAEGFGLVVCGLAITHCENIRPPIKELARVARPGGRIVISDVHPFGVLLGAHVSFPTDREEIALMKNYHHSHGDYIRAIHAAGLQINDCVEPAICDAEVEMMVGGRAHPDLRPEIEEVSKRALVGLPLGLIWELRKPG